MSHTKLPWTIEVHEKVTSIESKYFTVTNDVSNEDAKRIVACVTAMEGIDDPAAARVILDSPRTEAATDLLRVVKLIEKEWSAPTAGIQRGELIARLSQYAAEARAAIAKAEGRKS